MKYLGTLLLVLLGLSPPTSLQAQERVFLIRHAEKAALPDDPPLTADGEARAGRWAQMLQDSGLDVVISSDRTRSRQTADIIAQALDLPREEIPLSETGGLVDFLSFDYEDSFVLVVGHTETIPSIIRQLGTEAAISLDQSQFDNLFVVTPGKPLLHLRMP